jgi:hypothetical protein
MKKIRHSKLPITLDSSDHLDINMLQAIKIQLSATGWESWKDEYGNWFRPYDKNPNQLELFGED